MKITKQRLKRIIREELSAAQGAPKKKSVEEFKKDAHEHATEIADMYMRMDPNLHRQHQYEMAYKQFMSTFGDKYGLKEEMDAMRGAFRPGAGIEDIAAAEEEEVIDRAFDSPEGRLVTLIKAREVLGKMTRDELRDLSMSLDAEQVAVLRHILANPMYAPMEENITPGVQQLMKHHPHAAAKIKKLAGNGYRASEIKRMLQLR